MEDYFSGLCIGDWILVSNLNQGPKCKYDGSVLRTYQFQDGQGRGGQGVDLLKIFLLKCRTLGNPECAKLTKAKIPESPQLDLHLVQPFPSPSPSPLHHPPSPPLHRFLLLLLLPIGGTHPLGDCLICCNLSEVTNFS